MEETSYTNADNYTVEKERKGIFAVTVFKDMEGNAFATIKFESFGNKFALLDKNNSQIGLVSRKMIALNATYELFDGSNNNIGRIVVQNNFGFTPSENLFLQDSSGNTLVVAHGGLMNMNFGLDSPDGSKHIAIVSSNAGKEEGMLNNLKDLIMRSYHVEIVDKSINEISRLFILEFLVVIENMVSNSSRRGMGMGNMGNMGPMGGGAVFKL